MTKQEDLGRYKIDVCKSAFTNSPKVREWTWIVSDKTLADFDQNVACGAAPSSQVAWACARKVARFYMDATQGNVEALNGRIKEMEAEAARLRDLATSLQGDKP